MIMRILKWIGIVAVSALAAGLVVYLTGVKPLQQRLLEEKTRSLAHQVDSLIKVRASSLWAVTSLLDTENLRVDENIARSLTALRQHSSDFLSLEILDDQGAILAMLGDIPLSEAGRRGTTLEDVIGLKSSPSLVREWFSDDPANACLYVTTRHTAADGKTWFARARFAREQLEMALASANSQGTAQLTRTSSKVATVPEEAGRLTSPQGLNKQAAAIGSSGIVEVPLLYPGWAVVLEQRPQIPFAASTWAIWAGVAIVLIVVAFMLLRHLSGRMASAPRIAPGNPTIHRSDRPRPQTRPGRKTTDEAPQGTVAAAPRISAEPSEECDRLPHVEKTASGLEAASDAVEPGPGSVLGPDVASAEGKTLPEEEENFAVAWSAAEEPRSDTDQAGSDDLPDTLEVSWFEPELSPETPLGGLTASQDVTDPQENGPSDPCGDAETVTSTASVEATPQWDEPAKDDDPAVRPPAAPAP